MKTNALIVSSLLATIMLGYAIAGETPSVNSKETSINTKVEAPEIAYLRDFTSKRASSWDRTGGNADWIIVPGGKTNVLFDEKGMGCIKHFYWTYIWSGEARARNLFHGVVLHAFWDGDVTPSIEVPLGEFFGVSSGQCRPIRSLAFVTNPSFGFNCYLPMPFEHGGRLEIENQGDVDAKIWFHVDYELYPDGHGFAEDVGRLHAWWNRENPIKAVRFPERKNLTGKDNYTILDVAGDGQFAGYFLTVVNTNSGWWGEGDDMIFIDGEGFPPSIHGTGTEEIFGGGPCPVTEYSGPYTGFHCIENRAGHKWLGINGMYRFYLADPLRFRKSIRVTIEPDANNFANDYSSVAFWYQRGINHGLKPLPLLEKRAINLK